MLEHVALNQSSFKLPGVAPDSRGVLLGKQGAALLPSFDRLVTFLRLLSEESPLDDVLPSLKIWEVRTRLGAREHLLLLQAQSSYLLDRCARILSLCGGSLFTGSTKHYVKYRDRRSPLGYDVDALHGEPADFILYADAYTQGYSREREIPFQRILFGLELTALPGGAVAALREGATDLIWLTARRGLGQPLLTYLWRSRVRADAALLLPGEDEGARLLTPQAPERLLVRAEAPPRVLRMLLGVPGVRAYAQVLDNVIVELGHRHPLRLSALGGVFSRERLYLFSSGPAGGEALPLPPLIPIESLLGAEVPRPAEQADAPRSLRVRAPEPALEGQVSLRLVHGGRRVRVTAALVPWVRLGWLKRLVYALPPTLLAEYQAAPIQEGLLVISPRGIDVLPVGDLFREAAPSIFIPVGMELTPRVPPEVLSAHLGGTAGRHLLLLPEGAGRPPRAVAIAHGDFDALGRRVLAPLPVEARPRLPQVPRPRQEREGTLVNEPVGAAALVRALGALGSGPTGEAGGAQDGGPEPA